MQFYMYLIWFCDTPWGRAHQSLKMHYYMRTETLCDLSTYSSQRLLTATVTALTAPWLYYSSSNGSHADLPWLRYIDIAGGRQLAVSRCHRSAFCWRSCSSSFLVWVLSPVHRSRIRILRIFFQLKKKFGKN